jgi:hypothetical protein
MFSSGPSSGKLTGGVDRSGISPSGLTWARVLRAEIYARSLFLVIAMGLSASTASGQTDEIQVYDGQIATPGTFNLTLHDNYTFSGLKVPGFAGGLVPDHTLNGVPEWALGVTDWFEQGLYLPLYSVSSTRGAVLNGLKIRELFAVPHAAERSFFYGVNFEFSYNTRHWDPHRFTSEVRPILGLHLGAFDVIANPILDNSFVGFKRLDFAPAGRIAYHVSSAWTVALEDYADIGELDHVLPIAQQSQQLFGVVDFAGGGYAVEAGLGYGITRASDRLVAKLIVSRDLN